jgi:hypothetical protein
LQDADECRELDESVNETDIAAARPGAGRPDAGPAEQREGSKGGRDAG